MYLRPAARNLVLMFSGGMSGCMSPKLWREAWIGGTARYNDTCDEEEEEGGTGEEVVRGEAARKVVPSIDGPSPCPDAGAGPSPCPWPERLFLRRF